MVEVTEGGTALMSPEEVKQERERRDAMQRLRDMQRHEQQKQMWHLFSYTLPVAALVLGTCAVGIVFFVAFRIMANAWALTDWIW